MRKLILLSVISFLKALYLYCFQSKMKRFVFKRATRLKFPNDHSDPCSVFVSTWQAKKNVKKTLASYSFSENKRTKTVVSCLPVTNAHAKKQSTATQNANSVATHTEVIIWKKISRMSGDWFMIEHSQYDLISAFFDLFNGWTSF